MRNKIKCQNCECVSWADIGSIRERLMLCASCFKFASVKKTLERLKPINDPVITEALKEL